MEMLTDTLTSSECGEEERWCPPPTTHHKLRTNGKNKPARGKRREQFREPAVCPHMRSLVTAPPHLQADLPENVLQIYVVVERDAKSKPSPPLHLPPHHSSFPERSLTLFSRIPVGSLDTTGQPHCWLDYLDSDHVAVTTREK